MTEQRSHSRFGGSVASRWLRCPGSVALADTVPPRPTSSYAQEGKIAHALAEQCLRTAFARPRATPTLTPPICSTAREARSVTKWSRPSTSISPPCGRSSTPILRRAFRRAAFLPEIATADKDEVFGTNDALVYSPSRKRLAIFDYKHGAGVAVDATNNTQAKFYAVGAAFAHSDWPIEAVEIFIVQPRARNVSEAGAVKQWLMDPLELLEFSAELEAGSRLQSSPTRRDTQARIASSARPPRSARSASSRASRPPRWSSRASPSSIRRSCCRRRAISGSCRSVASCSARTFSKSGSDRCASSRSNALRTASAFPATSSSRRTAAANSTATRTSWCRSSAFSTALPKTSFARASSPRSRRSSANWRPASDKDELRKAKEAFSLKYTIKESSGVRIAPASDKRPAVNAVATDYASVKLPAA